MIQKENTSPRTVSLLGCGWLGLALAHSFLERGWNVRGSTTHPHRLSALSSLGIEPFLLRIEPMEPSIDFGMATMAGLSAFFSSSCLIINIPPEAALGADYHPGQIKAMLSMIERHAAPPTQLVYVSSTAVYGASQGFVTEDTVPTPDQSSGAILLIAEQLLASYALETKKGLTIVRPGGLIGPGRHPGLFLAGRKNAANGAAPVNMIHQIDLSDLIASLVIDHPVPPGETVIYNAVSSHHPLRSEFYSRAASAIGVEPPTFASTSVANAKIISSEKIRAVTYVPLRFDDLYSAMGAV